MIWIFSSVAFVTNCFNSTNGFRSPPVPSGGMMAISCSMGTPLVLGAIWTSYFTIAGLWRCFGSSRYVVAWLPIIVVSLLTMGNFVVSGALLSGTFVASLADRYTGAAEVPLSLSPCRTTAPYLVLSLPGNPSAEMLDEDTVTVAGDELAA